MSTAIMPRVMISATASNCGKTTIVSGLLRCLKRRGVDVISYKCGPDYIDPMFHRSVIGNPSRNLDLYFSTEPQIKTLLAESSTGKQLALMEGAMGFYDGIGNDCSTQASAYHVAHATDTPVILIVDGRGVSLTIAAVIKGMMEFREGNNIKGVIINRCSKMMCSFLGPMIERECGVKVVGHVVTDPEFTLESRHLGLVTAGEVEGLQEKIDHIADSLEQSIDFEALMQIAESADPIEYEPSEVNPVVDTSDGKQPVIAVANDDAFCFYYEESLETLRRLGARIVEFSPISDEAIPEEADACYFGGGYPELHLEELSSNKTMIDSVVKAHEAGMPIFAECGGFLYLKQSMEDPDGKSWPMTGILPGNAWYTGKLMRFGYVELEARESGMGFEVGNKVRAHEFHYYDSEFNGQAMHAQKPLSKRSWDCCIAEPNLFAGFPHLYLPSCMEFASRFVEAAGKFHLERRCR